MVLIRTMQLLIKYIFFFTFPKQTSQVPAQVKEPSQFKCSNLALKDGISKSIGTQFRQTVIFREHVKQDL